MMLNPDKTSNAFQCIIYSIILKNMHNAKIMIWQKKTNKQQKNQMIFKKRKQKLNCKYNILTFFLSSFEESEIQNLYKKSQH
jgi:tryptophan-rich sensory protein